MIYHEAGTHGPNFSMNQRSLVIAIVNAAVALSIAAYPAAAFQGDRRPLATRRLEASLRPMSY